MNKKIQIALAILVALALVSCAEQGGLKAGTATAKSMLRLIPAEARVVFMFDVHRAIATDSAQNALKNEQAKQKYDEFVKASGIDPMKDVYFLALALHGLPTGKDQDGSMILNLRYNKDDLLARLKGAAKDVQEETYNGVTIYKNFGHQESGKGPEGAFLDDSNIVIGSPNGVRTIIDVFQKKKDSVVKSAEMKGLFKAVNTSAVVWGAAAVPKDLIKQAAEKNPMLKDLAGLTGVTMSFDYANKTLTVEIQGLGGTKEQNKTLAERLNALKSMGALVAAKLPLQGELLKTIEISSGNDHVKIYASIPSELLDKVQKMAREKFGGMIQMHPQAPKEDKKGEPEIKK